MTSRAYVIADVFTDVPLEGNPVAVFLEGSGMDPDLMQRLARELNLSETVFVLPASHGEADACLRIFTPATELPFAGHPVLGTAFALAEQEARSLIRLQTGAGTVPVQLRRERGRPVYGEMHQPIPEPVTFDRAGELFAAIGLEHAQAPVAAYRNGPTFVYVELETEEQLARLAPDMNALSTLAHGIGVSCFTGMPPRIETRMFAPGLGVPEDPATGSAAGPLAVHLLRARRIDSGQQLEISQGRQIGRPSTIFARVHGSPEKIERVVVGGAAVIVARGEYLLK
jgi:trans-2,3-dihydro-3-hydroxyanthranilate isomerase